MKLTTQQEAEILDVYEAYWGSLLNVDIELYEAVLDNDFRFIGTTEVEYFSNKKQAIQFLIDTADQVAGNIERRKSQIKIQWVDGLVLVTEQFDIYVFTEKGWAFYAKTRGSTWMQHKGESWKLIQQHLSFPDAKAAEGETIALEKISKENLQLREAVKRRTIELEHKNRELEIETALEKVTARTMAMQSSKELGDVAKILFDEMNKLVENLWTCGFVLCEKDRDEDEWWLSMDEGFTRGFFLPNVGDYAHATLYEGWNKGEAFRTVQLEGKKLQKHYDWLMKLPVARTIFEEMEASGLERPDWQKLHAAYFSKGYLCIITRVPCAEEEIFKRFAQSFNQTYTRFLDLQKAEAQAREAEIQLALEKVRARSMAMHHSGELGEVLSVLFDQFDMLGINPVFAHLSLIDLETNTFMYRMTGRGGKRVLTKQVVDLNARKEWKDSVVEFKKGKPDTVSCLHFPKEALPQIWELFNETLAALPKGAKIYPKDFPDGIYNTQGYCKFGYIGFNHNRPPTTEEKEIVVRFAKEFGRIYQRYLDIEKAEALAREAQIEAALERIRTRSMAMHASEELNDVLSVMFQQIELLGINAKSAHLTLMDVENNKFSFRITGKNGAANIGEQIIDLDAMPTWKETVANWKKAKPHSHQCLVYPPEMLPDLWKLIDASLKTLPAKERIKIKDFPDGVFDCEGHTKFGYIGFNNSRPPSEEEISIVIRFAREFERVYQRFLDIEKAEAQAREAQIQLSLERVRARSMAMHSSEELNEVLSILFQQFDVLGIKPINVWLSLLDEEKGTFTYRSTGTSGSRTHTRQVIAFNAMDIWHDVLDQWKSGTADPVLVTHYPAERLPELFEVFKETFMAMPEKERIHVKDFPNGFYNVQGYCKFGYIGYNHVNPPTEEERNLVSKFATEFERVYQRFLDIEKAEVQAREAQIEAALERLRAASMAMHQTEEIGNVVQVYFEQLKHLGIPFEQAWITILKLEEGYFDTWFSPIDGIYDTPAHFKMPSAPFEDTAIKNWKSGVPFSYLSLKTKKEVDQFLLACDEMTNSNYFSNSQQKLKNERLEFLEARHKFGFISKTTKEPPAKEDEDILMRFALVFEQTYTRFLDIQKAEAQAKESQIEAALEKVRSRSLAMQKAEELQDVVTIVGEKLQELGVILDSGGVVICTYFPDSKDVLHWTVSFDESHASVPYYLPYFDTPIWKETWHSKFETDDDFFEKVYSFEDKNHFFNYAFEHSDYKNLPDEYKKVLLESETHALSFAWQTNSALMIASHNGMLLPEEHKIILKRFAKVFEQAYIRFMDLQKAEKQTRESQIELSLERVRAKAMAMRQSEELTEVLPVIFEQLDGLGVKTVWTHLTLMDMEKNTFTYRMTGREGKRVFAEQVVDMDASAIWQNAVEAFKAEKPDSVVCFYFPPETLPGIWEIFDGIFSTLSEGYKIQPEDFPGGIYTTQANCEFGYIGINSTQKATEEEENILLRFAKEFGRLYRRFLDLQNAEAQARESQIQLSLERVRARSLAMQSSDELHEVLGVLFRQFDDLGIQPVNVFLSLFDREARTLTYRASGKSGKRIPGKQVVEVDSMEALQAIYDKWLTDNSDTVEVIYYSKEVLPQLFSIFAETFAAMPEEDRMGVDDFPEGGYSMAGYTPFGYLGYDHQREATQEEKDILSRFCIEFSRVYQRFLDIQKAEKQAREAQIETAMERVRARSLAMHHSDEMQSVANAVYDQLIELGIETDAVGMSGVIEAHKDYDVWIGGSPFSDPIRIPFNEYTQVQRDYNEVIEQRPELFARTYTGDIKNEYIQHLLQHGAFAEDLKSKMVESTAFSTSISTAKNSGIQIVRYTEQPYTDQENEILKRFAKVFEQAYIRFMDLQKAEAQARKAQIETALERVRARSMAMHQTNELNDVLCVLLEQFDFLGINPVLTHLTLFDEANEKFSLRLTTSPTEKILVEQIIDIHSVETWKDSFENWKKGDNNTVDCIDYPPEVLPAVWEVLSEVMNALPEGHKINPEDFPDGLFTTQGRFKFGYLGFNHRRRATAEEKMIVSRFATEFGRSYQRFLDIQKAEAQAREAQIEAALEKVRSRSLAMHKSEELGEVITVVVEKLKDLGFYTDDGVALITFTPGTKDLTEWMTNPGFAAASNFLLPHFDHPVLNNLWTAKDNGEEFVFKRFSPEESRSFHEHIFASSDFKNIAPEIKEYCLSANNYATSTAIQKNTAIFINDYSGKDLTEDEISILKRFAKVFEQAYIRFLDLQKAEEQTRESEIQLALERVRSRAMAMHSSEELQEVSLVLREQMGQLGQKDLEVCAIHLYEEDPDFFESWGAMRPPGSEEKIYQGIARFPKKGARIVEEMMQQYHADKKDYVIVNEKEKAVGWFEVLKKYSPVAYEAIIKSVKDIPVENLVAYWALSDFSGGSMLMVTHTYPDKDSLNLLRRSANVFDLAYRRFKDLKKAESQARESQIQLALERVRARTMAMHKSEELAETAAVLFQQMTELGVTPERLNICLINEKSHVLEVWSTDQEGVKINHHFNASLDEPTTGQKVYQAWKEKKKSLIIDLSGDELNQWIRYVREIMGMTIKEELVKEHRVHSVAFFSHGMVLTTTPEPLPEESILLLERFADVFNLTYRRFLDLQQAEEQARSAQIEAALERVRARAMAMNNSADLSAAIKTLFSELDALGLTPVRCGLGIVDKAASAVELWATTKNEDEIMLNLAGTLNTAGNPVLEEIMKQWGLQQEYHPVLEGMVLKEYMAAVQQQLPVPDWPEEVPRYDHYFYFPQGTIYVVNTVAPKEEELSIYRRFTSVMALTYQRYEDIVKSEERAREAIKDSSLDRVRAEIASMRSTEDLQRITPLIWRELTTLGVPFFRCGVFIIDEQEEKVNVYLSAPDGHSLGVMHLPFGANELTANAVDSWRQQEVYTTHWDKEAFTGWMKAMNEQGQISDTSAYQDSATAPESLDLHFIPFKQGMLYVGNSEPLDHEKIEMVNSLAEAFAIAYARYEDFNKIEQAKLQVEKTLADLKQAQSQLVQSEKMASLGELTAGIAHEIQNPLNFVNNFSEVSKELLDEIREELEKGNLEDAKIIMNDVIQNLEKINHHGKRADGIVKGMLQHSRSSSGIKEPTDMNALADEYLRLAYHGLRAKDKTFNANIKTEFDESLKKVNVIPQDMGRVILNLITNSFYVVNEKKKTGIEGYEPTVLVSTRRNNGMIEVSVKDNGSGIPQKVLDKIFQPFFTTKPTGQGTGLGLSLAYDIVKAHGGDIKVVTKEGEGTAFTIIFPYDLDDKT